MSPEQARNAKHVDFRSDIYALGVTLYHFVTGVLPFSGETTIELLMSKETGRFTAARTLNPNVPERLGLMLARTPEHRYASCDEVIRDLTALQLDNPSLSFITADDKAVIPPPTKASRPPVTRQPAAQTTRGTTASGKGKPTSAAVTADVNWFVRYTNASGRIVMSELTTSQVVKGIKAEMFDVKSKARKSDQGDFQSLSQFREFESAMKNWLIKARANASSHNLQEMYVEIDKQERRRHRWR